MTSPLFKRNWESQFNTWARPPSHTEQERCDRAANAVKKAIAQSRVLANRSISTFAQGSYANRTNVREDSDVDVCVLYSGTYFYNLAPGMTGAQLGPPASYRYNQYKNEVEQALIDYFGRANVVRGNKAFDIHENTYRVDADAVAVFEYRHHYVAQSGSIYYHKGTALLTDNEGRLVTNFPQQHYDNGVAKNKATSRRFKALTRIVKNLRNEMDEVGIPQAKPITSFLIESLAWNWPNELFNQSSWTSMVNAFLAYIWSATETDHGCSNWREVNGIKLLFGSHNEWSRLQVHQFAEAAYVYIEGS